MTRLVVIEVPENAGRDLEIEAPILGSDVAVDHIAYDGDPS